MDRSSIPHRGGLDRCGPHSLVCLDAWPIAVIWAAQTAFDGLGKGRHNAEWAGEEEEWIWEELREGMNMIKICSSHFSKN